MGSRSREKWLEAGVFIGEEVCLENIASDTVIHHGSRICGSETSIGSGCIIGSEAAATVENCQLGHNVALKGGFFSGATFLDGSNMGSCAHVRAGTILEEEANGAHSVGLKQTVFLPFVTAGSLINFCDALMAGGTSRKNHSEIGSSYIHFNFTPHQDKATPSLIGDIPQGVFLNNKPIFLGGQGGLVGPSRIAYGSVIVAGGICRKDLLEENQLHIPITPKSRTFNYESEVYGGIERIVRNNLVYIGNIMALQEWYSAVRSRYMNRDAFDLACLRGAQKNLNLIFEERVKRLQDLVGTLEFSVRWLEKNEGSESAIDAQKSFIATWPRMKEKILDRNFDLDIASRDQLMGALSAGNYIEAIQSLPAEAREAGHAWLQSIVDKIENLWS